MALPAPRGDERALKRHRSDATDVTAWDSPTSTMSRTAKRAKQQMDILKGLRVSLTVAAEMGMWTHRTDSLQPDSFKHYTNEAINAVDEMLKAAKEGGKDVEIAGVHKIANSLIGFLVRIITNSPCYPALCDFAGILTRAMPLAGDLLETTRRAERELIEKLAAIAPDSDAVLPTDGISVFERNSFRAASCYGSFVVHRGAITRSGTARGLQREAAGPACDAQGDVGQLGHRSERDRPRRHDAL